MIPAQNVVHSPGRKSKHPSKYCGWRCWLHSEKPTYPFGADTFTASGDAITAMEQAQFQETARFVFLGRGQQVGE